MNVIRQTRTPHTRLALRAQRRPAVQARRRGHRRHRLPRARRPSTSCTCCSLSAAAPEPVVRGDAASLSRRWRTPSSRGDGGELQVTNPCELSDITCHRDWRAACFHGPDTALSRHPDSVTGAYASCLTQCA